MSSSRKDDHVRLALEQETAKLRSRDFDDVRVVHHALAAVNVDSVSLDVEVADRTWTLPFYINGMTGGSEFTGKINQALAIAAAETGIAMASGSMSAYFKDPSCAPSFTVLREENPHGFLMANLSANASPEQAREAIELIDADALQIHVNAVQEIVMPEGDREFEHWGGHIKAIARAVDVPVVVKEVGFGMTGATVRTLSSLGVAYVDVAGNGGTDFARIESARRADRFSHLNGWGQSAVESLIDARGASRDTGIPLFASGGVRTSLDVLKALALGAKAVGIAGGFLATVREEGPEALIREIRTWEAQLRSMMALVGARNVEALTHTDLVLTGSVREYANARGFDLSHFARRSGKASGGSHE